MFDLQKKWKNICVGLLIILGGIVSGNVGLAMYGAKQTVDTAIEAVNTHNRSIDPVIGSE